MGKTQIFDNQAEEDAYAKQFQDVPPADYTYTPKFTGQQPVLKGENHNAQILVISIFLVLLMVIVATSLLTAHLVGKDKTKAKKKR